MNVDEARRWVYDRLEDGVHCPCCDQYAKLYPRPLPSATARVMIEIFRRNEGRWFIDLPPVLDTMKGTAHQGGYGTLAHHWGLLEAMPGERDDGSNRVGWWRLSDTGRAFVRGEVTVPKRALIYNNRCIGFRGEPITISDALREPFNYRDLWDDDE